MGEETEGPWHKEIRSFGRRRSRPRSPRQRQLMREVLPRVSVDPSDVPPADITKLFHPNITECWLEIGFGGAEHLIARACQHPQVGFIGSEPFEDGVAKALCAIKDHDLENVRLYADDIRHLLDWLPANSISRAFILFPDPWPKKRHHKRRLVNQSTLNALSRIMIPDARLRIATDIGDYVRTTFVAAHCCNDFVWLANSSSDWKNQPKDWIPTRYEQKAHRQGRNPFYLEFKYQPESDREGAEKA